MEQPIDHIDSNNNNYGTDCTDKYMFKILYHLQSWIITFMIVIDIETWPKQLT